MKVMNEENQNFADYVSKIDEAQLTTDCVSKLSDTEVLYDSDYDDFTFDPGPTAPAAVCDLNEYNLNSCNLDDGELTCGDDFVDNGEIIQGGPCHDLREYFSDKPYLD